VLLLQSEPRPRKNWVNFSKSCSSYQWNSHNERDLCMIAKCSFREQRTLHFEALWGWRAFVTLKCKQTMSLSRMIDKVKTETEKPEVKFIAFYNCSVPYQWWRFWFLRMPGQWITRIFQRFLRKIYRPISSLALFGRHPKKRSSRYFSIYVGRQKQILLIVNCFGLHFDKRKVLAKPHVFELFCSG
jgi:hypothetical protein